MPLDITKRFVRVRLKPPKDFVKLRNVDIGQKGYSKLIIGQNKKTGKWESQAMLISTQGLREQRHQEKKLLMNYVYNRFPKKYREIVRDYVR